MKFSFRANLPLVLILMTALIALCGAPNLAAQEVASLTGVVTDSTGAVISDASVRLIDTKTNATYEATSNSLGVYTFTKLQPGPGYTLTVKKEGFQSQTIDNIYLGVDATHTQNAQLQVGKSTETVEVNGSGSQVSLNTTDASISTTLDMNMVHELPLLVRDSPLGLLLYAPGVTGATGGDDNTLGSRDGAVTGARADQSNYTLDGMDANDFGTGQAFALTAQAPVDSVQEMRSETANPLSSEGRGSGAQVQLITKSGTNNWHGSAYAYNRTAATAANDYFNNRNDISRPPLTRNQFGVSLGGPVKRDKLFFFFNYEARRDARADSVNATVPLDSFRDGNVAYINNGTGCDASSRINVTPQCISTIPAYGAGTPTAPTGQSLDPGGIGPDAAFLSFVNGRYPHANDLTGGDGVNTGGFRWNAPAHRSGNDYVTRIDYNLSNKMKLFGRLSIYRSAYGDDANFPAAELFPGDPVSNEVVDHSWGFVVGHTWTISNTKVNQFNFGETRAKLDFPVLFNPTGTTQFASLMGTASGGSALTAPLISAASQRRTVPIPVFRDDFTYVRGKHNIQVGGTFKPIKSTDTLVSDFNNVTLGLGNGLNSLDPSTEAPPDLLTDATADPNGTAIRLWSQAYTSALGRIANVNSLYENGHDLQPLPQGTGHTRNYRYNETELYAQDSWRVRNDLTLSYGLRWQYLSVPYESNGLQASPNIDFATMYNDRVAAGAAGISGNDAVPAVFYNLSGKANHGPGLFHPNWRDFDPRISFAYNPATTGGFLGRLLGDRKTVIRGGAGVVHDHSLLSAINFFGDQSSFLFGQTVGTASSGSLASDPRFANLGQLIQTGLNPLTPITTPYEPYFDPVNQTFPTVGFTGLVNNLAEAAFDPNFHTPYSETFTLGIQRELPGNFMVEASYFGRFGHRLLSRSDAGQLVDFKDPGSGQGLVSQFTNMSLLARNGQAVPQADFWENQMTPTVNSVWGEDCVGWANDIGAPFFGIDASAVSNCTTLVPALTEPLVSRGDMADTVQELFLFGLLPPNVGLNPQFSSQLYFGNKSYSNYNGLLTSLHKRMSHGIQFDVNYTYSHSIDNSSTITNVSFGSAATGGYGGFLCDAIQLRSCRGNSDFDITHIISADGLFEIPVGRGRWLGRGMSGWLNQIVGGWQLAFLNQWHTGYAFSTVSEAFPVSFNANSPAVFVGTPSDIKTHIHNDPVSGQLQLFTNPEAAINAFTGPIGLQGPTRNNLRGPHFSNTDLSLNKHFVIRENLGMEFRAEAFNAFNHPNFALPVGSVADTADPSTFGVITSDAGARVMQFSLRLDF